MLNQPVETERSSSLRVVPDAKCVVAAARGDDGDRSEGSSESCSSLGTRSLPDGHGSAATYTSSPSTLVGAAEAIRNPGSPPDIKQTTRQGGVALCATSGEEEDDVHEAVTINLSSGEDMFAKPYDHSVSGHHVMLKLDGGLIWKATRSHREERFYVTMRYCCKHDGGTTEGRSAACGSSSDPDVQLEEEEEAHAPRRQPALAPSAFLGGTLPDEELRASAALIASYVPKFYGMRQVKKLRCAHDQSTPSTIIGGDSSSCLTDFPSTPRGDEVRFDSSAKHTAEDIVATFERTVAAEQAVLADAPMATPEAQTSVQSNAQHPTTSQAACEAAASLIINNNNNALPPASTNPALRRHSLLPSKAPEEGRPLDHHLPRTVDQLVDMIVLEDVCHGFLHPCVLELKMGSRQYGVNAPEEKRRSKAEKARRSSSALLGLRVSGYKRWNPKSRVYEAKGKHECFAYAPTQIEECLLHFFGADPQLAAAFHRIVRQFEQAFTQQTAFRFFTSSVLLVFDSVRPHETARLVMVDFAYTYRRSELVAAGDLDAHQDTDRGYLLGIESLACMLEHVLAKSLAIAAANNNI